MIESLLTQVELCGEVLRFLTWLTLKAGVVIGLALVTTLVLRRATSTRLHLVLTSAMVAALFMPVMAMIFPEWLLALPKNLPALSATTNFISNQSQPTTGAYGEDAIRSPWTFWALTLWALGTAILLSRTLIGLLATAKLVRRARAVSQARLVALYNECRRICGIRRHTNLVISSEVTSPFVWGIFRSTVVMPEAAEKWADSDFRFALLHELSHVRRLDSVWLVVVSLVSALHWVNPLVWMARKRVIIESEKACDDHVLNSETDGAAYAQHLLKVLSMLRHREGVVPVGVGMARRSHMEGRLMSILSYRKRSVSPGKVVVAIAVLFSLLLAFPLAGLQVQAQEKTDTVEEQVPDPDAIIKADKKPEMIYQEAPVYPDKARKAGIEGVVWIKVLVDKKGNVAKAMVAKTSGHQILDDAALEVAYKNKFTPAMQGENPVMVWVTYKVTFELNESKEDKKKDDG